MIRPSVTIAPGDRRELAFRVGEVAHRRARVDLDVHLAEDLLAPVEHPPVVHQSELAAHAQLVAKKEVLIDRQVRKHLLVLRHEDQPVFDRVGGVSDLGGLPVDQHLPAVGRKNAHDRGKEGAFARGVAPHQRVHLAGAQREVDPPQIKFSC